MKTKILLLLVFVSALAEAKTKSNSTTKELDNRQQTILKSTLDAFIREVNVYTDKIKSTTNKDSIKFYSKKIMKLEDKTEKEVIRIYNYKSYTPLYLTACNNNTEITVLPVTTCNGQTALAIPLNFNSQKLPDEVYYLRKIWDCASNIRFFHSDNPDKIKKNLDKLDKMKQSLVTI